MVLNTPEGLSALGTGGTLGWKLFFLVTFQSGLVQQVHWLRQSSHWVLLVLEVLESVQFFLFFVVLVVQLHELLVQKGHLSVPGPFVESQPVLLGLEGVELVAQVVQLLVGVVQAVPQLLQSQQRGLSSLRLLGHSYVQTLVFLPAEHRLHLGRVYFRSDLAKLLFQLLFLLGELGLSCDEARDAFVTAALVFSDSLDLAVCILRTQLQTLYL